MNYTITISNGGGQRLQLKRQFSYRDGYNGSECIIVTVTDGLEDGKGYNVTIFVDGGYMVGNSSSTILTFSKCSPLPTCFHVEIAGSRLVFIS